MEDSHGGSGRGALAEALRQAVESRETGSWDPGRSGPQLRSESGPRHRQRSTGGVVLIDDSELPAVRRGEQTRRPATFLATLGDLPRGRLWQALWLLVRETLWLVVLFWSLALLGGLALPGMGVAAAGMAAVGLRLTGAGAGLAVRRALERATDG